ncbi:MAG: DEAD/DEAH box helicase family protein [Gammaproteobacteria bacterium]|nr:DEAD/DEAH box helicase family protein [Gammaproteobacteria bacterium]MCY3689905.1 DEAD/DEAH box helicase family protein [Gammaproteobacteria bacterium]MDE0510147.1 DEAD/DEAH box helicase family protein [Gammaproteobacteria bacterium]
MSKNLHSKFGHEHDAEEVRRMRERLAALDAERHALEKRLAQVERQDQTGTIGGPLSARVIGQSPANEKIALFRSLFRGRDDVYPKRWENARTGKAGYAPVCANEWKPGLCGKPALKCGACPNQAFPAISDEAIEAHLRGRLTLGVYPVLPDDACLFLAADFDSETWTDDAGAFLAACRSKQVPAALERSRSGNGGHVWIFFAEPAPAKLARQLGSHILTEAMESNPDIGFESYDRFFPSQDVLPEGGFGNLIALPLQGGPRECGNSVFLGDDLAPHEDQWAFLSSLRRMTLAEVAEIVDAAGRQGRVMGLRMPLEEEDREPWTAPPSGRKFESELTGKLPGRIEAVLADRLYVPRTELPPGLVNRLIRLAAFQNPEFYRAQAMRRSTFGFPRVVACAELMSHHIVLPRGCLESMRQLLEELGIDLELRDERNSGEPVEVGFLGELTDEQRCAADALLVHETGVLAAATGFGKSVIAAALIAERGVNTLILVHRRQLLDQWVAQLGAFLDLPASSIGRIGGGKRNPGGIIDVATLQSLERGGAVDDVVADYGHLIVDECHHLSAVSFEAVVRRAKAKYVLGLSATVTRRDGHHPIVFMQCGPVRFQTSARSEALRRRFRHTAILRATQFRLPEDVDAERPPIQRIYAALANDEDRNTLIFDDILAALKEGRSPILLTERKDHARRFAERLEGVAGNVLLLHGGMGAKQRREVMQRLEDASEKGERMLIATGRYVGEGFDDARLDTLFLAMPVSWKGTLTQYVGRLHRLHPEKREVRVYDYFDHAVPALNRMGAKRVKGYESLGYTVRDSLQAFSSAE